MEQKKILLIGTGGTIASEMGESGLTPELTSEQLLRYIPDISGICQVTCLQLFSLDSTNIQPKHWARIAGAVREHYREYDGFVISHGTDTMAYTAAGLSYLVQGCPKPRSSWAPVPGRPARRASRPSPASTTPCWAWCGTGASSGTSAPRPGLCLSSTTR